LRQFNLGREWPLRGSGFRVSIPVTPLFEAQVLMSLTVGKAEAAMSSAASFRLSITDSGQPYFARI
jgi:hypothetical protein